MVLLSEANEKENRLRVALQHLGYDSVIITRRSNFAWLTCGGEAVASRVSPTSPVYLVITPEQKYAVGYSMDLPWTMDNALAGGEYTRVLLRPFGKSPEEAALELAAGRAAADDSFLGVDDIGGELIRLHEPFTPEEMLRYRQLGKDCAEIQVEMAAWIEPGMTERQVLAHMWQLYLGRGIEGHYMFVGADERIERYRHPVPTDKRIERAVMLAPGVSRWGLLASTSRLIYFDQPPAEIRRRFDAAATIQASLLEHTVLGTPLTSLFGLIMDLYEQLGYPEERHNHFHGGPVGYWAGYSERMQHPAETVKRNMAFLYFITLAGVHTEELMLVEEQGPEIVTVEPNWPHLSVAVSGRTVTFPDILVKT